MGIIEILLISIGLSFDVFVVHICVGAGFLEECSSLH